MMQGRLFRPICRFSSSSSSRLIERERSHSAITYHPLPGKHPLRHRVVLSLCCTGPLSDLSMDGY